MSDKYFLQDTVSLPSKLSYEVDADDNVALDPIPKALYIGTGGNVVISCVGGANCTFVNVANGTVLEVRAEYVYSTGTTANNIIAL